MRYFLDRDSSGHWYLVPAEIRDEWYGWIGLDENDEASWDVPDGVTRLFGGPHDVEFGDPTFT